MPVKLSSQSVYSLVVTEHEGVGGGRGEVVGCLTSQQHDSVSQGRICTDDFSCCHTELFTSPSHSILTPGRPVPSLTL